MFLGSYKTRTVPIFETDDLWNQPKTNFAILISFSFLPKTDQFSKLS
jgi:hypothetical protein